MIKKRKLIITTIICLFFVGSFVENASASLVWSDDFERGNSGDPLANGWSAYDDSCNYISTQRVHGGTRSKKTSRSECTGTNNGGAALHDLTNDANSIPASKKLFISYWLYIEGSGNFFDSKFMRFTRGGSTGSYPTGAPDTQMEIWGCGAGADCIDIGAVYSYYSGTHDCISTWSGPQTPLISQNTWHRIVFNIEYNTPGNSDGLIQIWLDGDYATDTPDAEVTNAAFTGDSSDGCYGEWTTLHLPSGHNTGSPPIYIDDLEIWDDLPGEESDVTAPSAPNGLSVM